MARVLRSPVNLLQSQVSSHLPLHSFADLKEAPKSDPVQLRSKVIAKHACGGGGGWLRLRLERVLPMETGEQQDSKKARVDPDPLLVLHGWKNNTVSIDKAKLQCPVCTSSLKPPIFQCADGHLACGACHGQLSDKDRCYKCAHPGGYSRNLPLEDIVRSTKAWCPNFFYGCNSPMMILYELEDHQPKCPHAPCSCSEPGCAFIGSPTRISYHLRDTHSWPVKSIGYGKSFLLHLLESKPRCLLLAEDGHTFIVSMAALPVPAAALCVLSLACLRRNATPAGPHYTCKMWATGSAAAVTGQVPTIVAEMEVPSSAVTGDSGEAAATEKEDRAALVVHRKMLRGPSKELNLLVVINKVKVQVPKKNRVKVQT